MTPRPRRTLTADHASGAPFLRRVVGMHEKFEDDSSSISSRMELALTLARASRTRRAV